MSIPRIALLLTTLYWIAAVVTATLAPQDGWVDLRWPLALYFFAIPATVLLWTAVAGVRFFRPALRPSRFILIGVALPLLYLALVLGGGRWLTEWRQQRLEEQLRLARLESLEDEPLADANGPIGVRLRYRVIYPRGLDLDEEHGAFALLRFAQLPSAFVRLRRTVLPRVFGDYRPGTYEITEDFLPSFLPISLYAEAGPGASDRCFRWPPATSRRQILALNAQPLAIAIYLAHRPIQRLTAHVYRLADNYATALQEGADDCAP
jgi:hypothetical protein